jgi:hypothetical protein
MELSSSFSSTQKKNDSLRDSCTLHLAHLSMVVLTQFVRSDGKPKAKLLEWGLERYISKFKIGYYFKNAAKIQASKVVHAPRQHSALVP